MFRLKQQTRGDLMSFILNLFGQLSFSGIAIVVLIIVVFAISFATNLIVRSRYIQIQKSLDNKQQRKTGMFHSQLLNKITSEYKSAASGSYNEVNTQAIVEKCFDLSLKGLKAAERFVNNSVSILIILGLLGTFLGLTISVGRLGEVINQTNVADFINNPSLFITGLVSAVGGMAVAFVTSLFGIACSIILTILNIIFNVEEERETLMVNIEEYLDNSVAQVVNKDKETEYTMMNRILRETFIEFGGKIENTLKKTVESFGDKLSHVVMDVHVSSKTLDATVEKFDAALKNFAQNIRDFSEFNFSLKNNIERMDVSFIKVTEALADTSRIIVENYSSLESFSHDIRNAAEEMTAYNRQVVQDINSLVAETRITVSSIKELGEALSSELNARTGEMRQYQERFGALMGKLSEEITLLGEQTAAAFSHSLAENGKALSEKISENIQNILREVFLMLDAFKENERILAKTIAMLPDQTLTYNEAAVAKITKNLDEIKGFLAKPDRTAADV